MALQDDITQLWVKITGRKVNPVDFNWLLGPIGNTTIIKDQFFVELAEKENLEIHKNIPNSGLLETIDALGLSAEYKLLLNKKVIDFYENTSNYNFEVWSQWRSIFKPFGKLLSILFSKRLQQLNLPLSTIDTAKGLKSEIVKLKDKTTKHTKWTIWYRILKSNNNVIFSGIYTSCTNPNFNKPQLKIIFPLPNGNATVLMTITVKEDGSLLLASDGKKFGDNGFYLTLTNHKGNHWARFVRSMHESLRVYTDDEAVLRADHKLKFYGFPFLNFHYKITKKTH